MSNDAPMTIGAFLAQLPPEHLRAFFTRPGKPSTHVW